MRKQLTIINGEEQLKLDFEIVKDSFFVRIPNFDSHLEGHFVTDKKLNGIYVKDAVEDYVIPFTANYSLEDRFVTTTDDFLFISQKYDVNFYSGNKVRKAIGIFEQTGKKVTGSFATETGDYRFLEGIIDGNKLNLSTFDGSHLFLFTADIEGDSLVNGEFISGKSGHYTWDAVANKDVQLRNPEELTYIIKQRNPEDRLKLLSSKGDSVSLADEQYKNKVIIIQIMGTWCPNCLDETRYFNTLYKKYHKDGLEIVAVAFENGDNTDAILKKLGEYKKTNHMEYPILYGGKAANEYALELFPYLNNIMSFPTTIYFDKNNNIRKIYTGFYGPGTGIYYEEYKATTEKFIEDLLAE